MTVLISYIENQISNNRGAKSVGLVKATYFRRCFV